MTNETRPSDETNRGEGGDRGEICGPDTLKRGVFAAWKADHPEGSQQQFDDEWAALTSAEEDDGASRGDPSWDKEAEILEHRFFEEWIALHPDGTRQQFEDEWRRLTASSSA
jgi:hypothetical protein